MANYLSPGVYSSEIDLTTSVPSIATGITAYAGKFNKGQAFKRTLVTNVDQLIAKFGLPDNKNYNDWFQAERFLRNGSELYLVRSVDHDTTTETLFPLHETGREYHKGESVSITDTGANALVNATALVTTNEAPVIVSGVVTNDTLWEVEAGTPSGFNSMNSGLEIDQAGNTSFYNSYVPNSSSWDLEYENASFTGANQIRFSSRFVGEEANNISVSIGSDLTSGAEKPVEELWNGVDGVDFSAVSYALNDIVYYENKIYKSLQNSNTKIPGTVEAISWWEDISHGINDVVYYNDVNWYSVISNNGDVPSEDSKKWSKGTTFENIFEYSLGTDELAVVIFDSGSPVESYIVSTKPDGVDIDGNNIFIDNVINENSEYMYFVSKDEASFPNLVQQAKLSGGLYTEPSQAHLEEAYNSFENASDFDVSIIIANETINQTCIDISNQRKDCITIAGVPRSVVVGSSTPIEDMVQYLMETINIESSYGAVYGNYIQIFDQYNSKYRWINIAGAVAGSQVRTNSTRDAWWANAGMERGQLGDVIKIAYNPNETERGILYRNKINPIVSFPGQGNCIIWGQKTLLSRKSAFDRINVRQLFLVVEKAINKALKYFVFELNDVFTRAQIIAMITPFLEDIKGRRGIYEYKIIADETINTAQVIDTNVLKVNVLIKPTRVAEFIQVQYVAARSGANLSEVAKQIA